MAAMKGDFEDFITVRIALFLVAMVPWNWIFFFFLRKINNEGNTPSKSNFEDFIMVIWNGVVLFLVRMELIEASHKLEKHRERIESIPFGESSW